MTLRTRLFLELVCSHVPEPPARVLEIGCGQGELAFALAESGFEVTAIDPQAPDGALFRRVALEDFSAEHGFDAVVASLSLHHIHDLGLALDKIASFLPASGPLVLEEWASERFDGATARWYYEQRRALASVGRAKSKVPDDFDAWRRESTTRLDGLHPTPTMLAELETRFAERFVERRPYLYSWALDDALLPLERALIAEGAVEATGLWYVGERR
ncbi:MAG: class I SAM-dependent methyltransferase [Gaiellaceae bacterium]